MVPTAWEDVLLGIWNSNLVRRIGVNLPFLGLEKVLLSLGFLVRFLLEAWVYSGWYEGEREGVREPERSESLGSCGMEKQGCGSRWGRASSPGSCACGHVRGRMWSSFSLTQDGGTLLSTFHHCLPSQDSGLLNQLSRFSEAKPSPKLDGYLTSNDWLSTISPSPKGRGESAREEDSQGDALGSVCLSGLSSREWNRKWKGVGLNCYSDN